MNDNQSDYCVGPLNGKKCKKELQNGIFQWYCLHAVLKIMGYVMTTTLNLQCTEAKATVISIEELGNNPFQVARNRPLVSFS